MTINGNNCSSGSGKSVIVIGAGVGGSAIAARLGRLGYNVTVYEKNDFSGGRCSLIHSNGHRWDQGPSLYLMPKMFEETFADLGEAIGDHLELLKCPINYRVHFHDGKSIELSTDIQSVYRQLETFEGTNESTLLRFLDFLKESHVHYERSVKMALKTRFSSIFDLLRLKYLPELFHMHLYSTVYRRATKYFKTDHMIKAFTFQSMYMGMSPYDSPGPYSLLQYTEIAEGIWYPKGGFNKVVEKLIEIGTNKYGVKFNYSSPVGKINVINDDASGKQKVTGVTLTNGEVVDADMVICNADLVFAYNHLLPPTPYATRLGKKDHTSSSISFYWGLKQSLPQFTVHNVFLAQNYKASFDEIFKGHTLPTQASFYVNVPSKIDPSAAPEGKDTMVILVPTGCMTNETGADFDGLVARARTQVIETIEAQLKIEDFASYIETEIVNDPRTWKEKFNLWNGSILGLSHSIPQVLCFRPDMKSPIFDNLYFVGASTQPGTGVPIVLCGAKLLQDQIESDNNHQSSQSNCKQPDNCQSNVWFNLLIPIVILLFFYFFFGTN